MLSKDAKFYSNVVDKLEYPGETPKLFGTEHSPSGRHIRTTQSYKLLVKTDDTADDRDDVTGTAESTSQFTDVQLHFSSLSRL